MHINLKNRKEVNDMEHKGTKTIETERLTLRPFRAEDAEAMFRNWESDRPRPPDAIPDGGLAHPVVLLHHTWHRSGGKETPGVSRG